MDRSTFFFFCDSLVPTVLLLFFAPSHPQICSSKLVEANRRFDSYTKSDSVKRVEVYYRRSTSNDSTISGSVSSNG